MIYDLWEKSLHFRISGTAGLVNLETLSECQHL